MSETIASTEPLPPSEGEGGGIAVEETQVKATTTTTTTTSPPTTAAQPKPKPSTRTRSRSWVFWLLLLLLLLLLAAAIVFIVLYILTLNQNNANLACSDSNYVSSLPPFCPQFNVEQKTNSNAGCQTPKNFSNTALCSQASCAAACGSTIACVDLMGTATTTYVRDTAHPLCPCNGLSATTTGNTPCSVAGCSNACRTIVSCSTITPGTKITQFASDAQHTNCPCIGLSTATPNDPACQCSAALYQSMTPIQCVAPGVELKQLIDPTNNPGSCPTTMQFQSSQCACNVLCPTTSSNCDGLDLVTRPSGTGCPAFCTSLASVTPSSPQCTCAAQCTVTAMQCSTTQDMTQVNTLAPASGNCGTSPCICPAPQICPTTSTNTSCHPPQCNLDCCGPFAQQQFDPNGLSNCIPASVSQCWNGTFGQLPWHVTTDPANPIPVYITTVGQAAKNPTTPPVLTFVPSATDPSFTLRFATLMPALEGGNPNATQLWVIDGFSIDTSHLLLRLFPLGGVGNVALFEQSSTASACPLAAGSFISGDTRFQTSNPTLNNGHLIFLSDSQAFQSQGGTVGCVTSCPTSITAADALKAVFSTAALEAAGCGSTVITTNDQLWFSMTTPCHLI